MRSRFVPNGDDYSENAETSGRCHASLPSIFLFIAWLPALNFIQANKFFLFFYEADLRFFLTLVATTVLLPTLVLGAITLACDKFRSPFALIYSLPLLAVCSQYLVSESSDQFDMTHVWLACLGSVLVGYLMSLRRRDFIWAANLSLLFTIPMSLMEAKKRST